MLLGLDVECRAMFLLVCGGSAVTMAAAFAAMPLHEDMLTCFAAAVQQQALSGAQLCCVLTACTVGGAWLGLERCAADMISICVLMHSGDAPCCTWFIGPWAAHTALA